MKYKTIKLIDLHDWDELVQQTYGKPYRFQQQDGCQSRGLFRFSVPSESEPEDFENKTLPFKINGEKMGIEFNTWLNTTVDDMNTAHPERHSGQNNTFWERNYYPSIDMVINDLFNKGLIEEGDYAINIDW